MGRCCAEPLSNTTAATASNGSAANDTVADVDSCPWYGELCHRYCTRKPHSEPFGIHCSGRGYCANSGRNCICDRGYADGPDGICARLLDVPEVPMDPALRAFINYGIPLLSLGLIVEIGLFVMAYLRRRQASEQVAEIEEAILKKLTMPTLEELDGELPGADPFAPGADNTDGMNIRDKQVFLGHNCTRTQCMHAAMPLPFPLFDAVFHSRMFHLTIDALLFLQSRSAVDLTLLLMGDAQTAQLEKRKKRWQDANVINLDPNEILEEKVIDAAVTGYLYAGKYEKDPGKASVVAVGRRATMQEKGRELLGDNAKGLEEFYTERADALVLAGNRLPESRTRPLRVLDGRYDLDDALQDRQVCVVRWSGAERTFT